MRFVACFFMFIALSPSFAEAQFPPRNSKGFARYLPNESVTAENLTPELASDIFSAFENLEPVRPPKFVSHQLSKLVVNIRFEIANEFFVQQTGLRILPPTTFWGKVIHETDYVVTIPMGLQAMNRDARVIELTEFFKSAFPTKMVKRAVASEMLQEWAARLESEGRLPKAKSGNVVALFGNKTCEAVFTPSARSGALSGVPQTTVE